MIKTIDLFAGAGGLSYGFLMTGEYQLVAAAEINKNARKTYQASIVKNNNGFEFIENVIDYDFSALNTRFANSIDVVIGGPPCQGFSNANRQKNHLISMNNSLVKEYFRAIREIKPKAFVMENVSMLESDTHRFYESRKDNREIDELIANGHIIPKRKDSLTLSKVSYDGIDNVEFLISSNLGEEYKPISKIASGGEMSRIMLAFKSIIANKDNIKTLIFDEIDTGISGKTAQIVGNKIKKLSKDRQVIVISHLPQIISLANCHFLIEKEIKDKKTISKIKMLNQDERVMELARLVGGINITDAAINAAKEMLGVKH